MVVLVGVVGAQPVGAAGNPIQTENAQAGSWDWQRALASPAPAGSIDGYLGAASAAPGATVTVHASTSPAATFRAEVFRVGYYGGVGGRFMACAPDCSGSVQGETQTTPSPEPGTGRIRANWPVSTSFTVGSDWVSGYYVVNFVLTSGPNSGRATWTPLIVTAPPERDKQILVHAATTTWQAYNNWGGKSLYDFNSTGGRAHKVSFDRPYLTNGNTGMYDWEVQFVRWLEREGYDVAYASDIDSHRNTALLQSYRLVLINGHDEYWSTPVRDSFENAKAAGTNIASFGANIGYWHVRFEDGERTMVGYKDAGLDPNTNPAAETVKFRDLQPPRPECALTGVQYVDGYSSGRTYTVVDASLSDPWMAGTGFAVGSTIPGVVGYEWDTIVSGCTAGGVRTTFFQYPGSAPEQLPAAHLTRHVLPSGTILFSTGTMDWALKLDPWASDRDARMEAFTRNVLAAMQQQGTNSPPTVSLTAPAGGATVSGATAVSATATDDVSVAGVQFKLDGANLGSEATSSPYGISWDTTSVANGQHMLTAVARDGANLTTTSAPVTVTVSNASNQPPTVTLTAPPGGATVSGATAVSATATDDVSVAGVQFKLDGANLGSEDTSSPYGISWDTTSVANGQHMLTAVARDGANLTATSAPVTVTVSNAAPPSGAVLLGAAKSGDNGSSPSLVFNLPAMQAGDQIVVGVQASNDTSFTLPPGWTVVRDFRPTTSWHPRVVVLRRAATAGETTVTIQTGHIGKTGVAVAYRGLDPTTPVIATTTASVDSTTLTVPGITPGVSGARLAFFTGAQGHPTPTGWSPPAGMTEVGDTNTLQWISIAGHEQLLTSGAAAGSRSAVFGGSFSLSGVLVALRPASGPPDPPPTVSVTQPADNATVSGTTSVSANASDDTGVAGVQFKLDGANLGPEDTSSPYTISWDTTAVANGQHTLTAVARDSASQTTTSTPISVTVNNVAPNQPPTVSVTQPANNATVSGTAPVSANANDDVSVAGVQFRLDGTNLGVEDTSAPFTLQWDTTTVANGQHTLTAVARDGPGLTTTSTPVTVTVSNAVNQPPTIAMTAPADSAIVSGTTSVSANAGDDVSVAGVQFRLDGTNLGVEDTSAPFTLQWDTTTVANGQHTLTAVARDGANLTTTSVPVTVTVSNAALNQPPTVSITAPANAATVSATISVTANAADDVSVAGVQFKLDGANLGAEDTTSPYSVSWNTATVANGQHTLTAVGRDGPGLTTTSAPVTVTVNNVAPAGSVLAYNFEQSGTFVPDRSGNGNNGTISGATWIASGRYGRALSFDGTNDLVQVADSASLDLTTALTVEAWVYPTALGAVARPVAVKQVTGSSIAYGLYAHRNSPRRPSGIATVNAATASANGTSALAANAWSHVGFTFDGTSLRLYVNGTLVRTTNANGSIAATAGQLLVGSDSAAWYRGRLDDLRIYNRALTAAEITADSATPVP